jgi:cobalamin biosynthesis protein CobT
MKREKWTTGYRTGRLDTNRLTDVLRNKEDLFRRKETTRLVDSAVYLLVDSSGSMSGHPFQNACAAAVMMAESLQGIGVNN